ncbi:Armadillo repeat-containing protein 3 and Serine/threonine-protein kinase CTR1 [Corchorus capsularis]|uniref:Armadillo repeat-containing protein 3 and Serine/threonine-protein kinase CTR1 n=1 Tax=Corchorus capsularis TaxID=210143 RepID=A0A1R3IFC0_COCAP|nr:Armadillo repeat-containing protein 3 and Serine/threonine-protein kinase CTR1 [Corchorus capsularis]
MNPYLWLMCNEVEEGSRLPSLMSLKEIEPSEISMEVVLVDKRGDRRLKELEEKAQELYCASENTLVLADKLGQLVAIYMGSTNYPNPSNSNIIARQILPNHHHPTPYLPSPCQLSLKKEVIDKLPTVFFDEELRIRNSQIYKVHDEAKDKAFELEMSWVCDESKAQSNNIRRKNLMMMSLATPQLGPQCASKHNLRIHKEPSFTAKVNYQTEVNYLKSLPGYPVESCMPNTRSSGIKDLVFNSEPERTPFALRRENLTQEQGGDSSTPSSQANSPHSTTSSSSLESQPPRENMGEENNNRTLRELVAPNVATQRLAIQYSTNEENFEIKSGFIQLLLKFHDMPGEDPHRHLTYF